MANLAVQIWVLKLGSLCADGVMAFCQPSPVGEGGTQSVTDEVSFINKPSPYSPPLTCLYALSYIFAMAKIFFARAGVAAPFFMRQLQFPHCSPGVFMRVLESSPR